MNTPNSSNLTLLVLLPLIAWRMYIRLRRSVGRQRLSKVRPWITVAVFSSLIVFLGATGQSHPDRLWCLAASVGLGSLLGVFGLRKTRFDPTPEGLFYTPNVHLGIALSLLFVIRIIYRVIELQSLGSTAPQATNEAAARLVTLAVFGLLSGYYIAYAIGLIRWRFSLLNAKRQLELPSSQ